MSKMEVSHFVLQLYAKKKKICSLTEVDSIVLNYREKNVFFFFFLLIYLKKPNQNIRFSASSFGCSSSLSGCLVGCRPVSRQTCLGLC